MIPFLKLTRTGPRGHTAAIARVVDRGWSILGPELDRFESAFAAATGQGMPSVWATATDALAIALRAAVGTAR